MAHASAENTRLQAPDRNSILLSAIAYAERGVKVFATTADGKAPSISNRAWSNKLGREVGKGQGGLHQATTDIDNIKWQFSWKNSGGIGMPCGKVNGVIVADFDIHKEQPGGNAHRVMEEWRDEIAETHQVRTRNGGVHAYFAYEPGHGKHELGENIEVQTDGSYVLLPPSKGYKVSWKVDRGDWQTPPWKAVANKGAGHSGPRPYHVETPADVLQMIEDIHANAGNWHNAMVQVTAYLVGCGWSDAQILRFVPQWRAEGYSHEETFDEVCVAIEGARAKWRREKEQQPADSHDARLLKFADLWRRSAPNTRKEIRTMVEEASK